MTGNAPGNISNSKRLLVSNEQPMIEDVIISRYPNVINVSAVEPLGGFTVRVTFSDQTQREINLEKYLYGPIFEPIRNDPAIFKQVYIDHGALAWRNGADIDTDTLYYDGAPLWATANRV